MNYRIGLLIVMFLAATAGLAQAEEPIAQQSKAAEPSSESSSSNLAIQLVTKDGKSPSIDLNTSGGTGQALDEGAKLMKGGDPQRAITEYFDPVIEHFNKSYQGKNTRYFSAQSLEQSLIYTALHAKDDDKKSTEVLGPEWSMAYLLKAYALSELKRISEAQEALNSAIALSPLTSQYFSELGYTYQAQKNCDKSLEVYKQAESVVDLGSEDKYKVMDKTRALRGQGYCLVEQGKLDEAVAVYKKCLELDPDDQRAKGELQYIQKVREKGQ